MLSDLWRFRLLRILTVPALAYLGMSLHTELQNQHLCTLASCQIASSDFRFNAMYLTAAALLFVFLMMFSSFSPVVQRSIRLRAALELLCCCGLACEAFFLTYQAFVLQQMCSYCVVVASFIIPISFLGVTAASLRILVPVLLAFVALSSSFYYSGSPSTFFQTSYATMNQASASAEAYHLVVSPGCQHCKELLEQLAVTAVTQKVRIHTTALPTPAFSDELRRLSPMTQAPEFVSADIRNSKRLLYSLGLSQVPVIFKQTPSSLVMLTKSAFFEELSPASTTPASTSLFPAADAACSVYLPSCDTPAIDANFEKTQQLSPEAQLMPRLAP